MRQLRLALLTAALVFQGAGALGCNVDPDPVAPAVRQPIVATGKQFSSGMVTFSFDDGWIGQATYGAPLLEARGWHGTFFLVPEWLGKSLNGEGFMSIGQARGIAARGHEIGDHTMTHKHLPTLSLTGISQQMVECKAFLATKLGLAPEDIQSFASPYGDYDDRVVATAKSMFSSHRTTADGLNAGDADPYALSVVSLGVGHGGHPVHTGAMILADINTAAEERSWLIFLVHGIVTDHPRRPTDFQLADFYTILDQVSDAGLRVVTMRQGVDELRDMEGDTSAREEALDNDLGN